MVIPKTAVRCEAWWSDGLSWAVRAAVLMVGYFK
jgi:hypothetical protein